MKAYQVISFEKPAELMNIAKPAPAKGQVLLEVAACGLNFADLLMAAGKYQEMPEMPATLGMEVSGTVVAAGDGVEELSVGDRVAVNAIGGGLAEFGCFQASSCIPIPDEMPFQDAAAIQVAYGTGHLSLHYRARLKANENLLVLGAAGGVGLAAVELGKLAGATVIAVARGAEKLDVARRAGADHLIDSETGDIRAEVKALGGADVVFDPVGGDQFTMALRACKPHARYIVIGFASGEIPQVPANIILVKNITVHGFYWGGYKKCNPKPFVASLAEVFQMHAEGRIHPHISHVLPLDRVAEALNLLRRRVSTGKIIVLPRPHSL